MCDVAKGRKLACKDQRGGIKRVDFAVFQEYGFVIAGKVIATLPESLEEVFRFDVKGPGNNLTETTTVSTENRTKETASVLAMVLPKLGPASEVEIDNLMSGLVIAFVHDYNGNVKAVGIDSGMDGTTATTQTGGAGTDLTGYNLNLQALDTNTAPYLSPAAIIALNALVSSEVIEP